MSIRSLTLLRDDDHLPACIEYSWVPTGKRHPIQLAPGQSQDSQSYDYQSATNVQIYVATIGDESIANWQIPIRGEKQILHAVIALSVRARRLFGTVFYEDGTSFQDQIELQHERRKCPTGL
jgi:hypothetical protein